MLIEDELAAIPKPQVYDRHGKDCFYDPYRENMIPATPEEEVRQKLLIWLEQKKGVPRAVIGVEQHLSHYGIESNDRADIIIHKMEDNNAMHAIAVIECKANSVIISDDAFNQCFGYADALGIEYAIVTNGIYLHAFQYVEADNQYHELEKVPSYVNLLSNDVGKFIPFRKPKRLTLTEIRKPEIQQMFIDGYVVGSNTPPALRANCINLLECFMDTDRTLSKKKGINFTVLEDKGIISPTFGNASGSDFSAPYRCFMVQNKQCQNKLVCLGFNAYGNEKTILCVGVKDYKIQHHALQLLVDTYMTTTRTQVMLTHTGKISVGNKGSGSSKAVVNKVAMELPHLYCNGKIVLGSVDANKLFMLDDPKVTNLIINLIDYALLRDEYRDEMMSKNSC